MSHLATSFLAVVVGLLPIVNPLGGAPIFLRLTEGASEPMRATLARRVAVNGLVLLVASLFIGSYVLAFFGLTVAAVQVAGGLVVIAYGWRMLHQGAAAGTPEREAAAPPEIVLTRAFFPLTMPLTVGPGSISVAITLGTKATFSKEFLFDAAGALLGALAIAASIYLCYRFAARVLGLLGRSGTDVLLRLSAFILLCLGVQILWNGYLALTAAPPL